jgi:hypothetical protein
MNFKSPSQAIEALRLEMAKLQGGCFADGCAHALDDLTEKLEASGLMNIARTGWRPIRDARHDGHAVELFGQHGEAPDEGSPPTMGGVLPGDLWIAIGIFDIWRKPPKGDRWVFSLNGAALWSPPLLFRPLDWPTLDELGSIGGRK